MENYSVGHLMDLESILNNGTTNLLAKLANSISNPKLANIAVKTTYIAAGALSQGLCEGEEEFATEILNYFSDELISGDLSSYTLAINNYMEKGYSEEEARKMANKDFNSQLEQAFLGGFVSGICFGSFQCGKTTYIASKHISQNIMNEYNGNNSQAFIQEINRMSIEAEKVEELRREIKKSKRVALLEKLVGIFNTNSIDNNIEVKSVEKDVAFGTLSITEKLDVDDTLDLEPITEKLDVDDTLELEPITEKLDVDDTLELEPITEKLDVDDTLKLFGDTDLSVSTYDSSDTFSFSSSSSYTDEIMQLKKEFGDIILNIDVYGNNHIFTTIYGDTITIPSNLLNSFNFYNEMLLYKYKHQAILLDNGNYKIVNKFGDEFIINPNDYESGLFLSEVISKTEEHGALLIDDWILTNVENIGNNLNSSQKHVIDQQLQQIADRVGSSSAEVSAAIDTALENIVEKSEFGSRVSYDVLESILNSHFKNQHETGSSNGLYNPSARRNLENSMFNIPLSLDAIDAPIYGMLFPKLEDASSITDYFSNGPGYWYGSGKNNSTEAVIIFDKNKIINNTTLTIGDSLDYKNNIIQGTAATSPKFLGAYDDFLSSVSSLSEIENSDLLDFSPIYGCRPDQYIELQIHGRYVHSTDVIQEIVLLQLPSLRMLNLLDSLKIKWRILT